jgi:hypothetical protein
MHDQIKIFSPLPNDFPNQGHRIAIDRKTPQSNLIPVMDESTHSLLRRHQLIIYAYAWRNLHDALVWPFFLPKERGRVSREAPGQG